MSELLHFEIRCPNGSTIPHIGSPATAAWQAAYLTDHFGELFTVIDPRPAELSEIRRTRQLQPA